MLLKGIVSIILSAFGFALMALFVRLCDDFGSELTCFQKSFFRNAIALVIASAVFFRSRDGMNDIKRLSSKAWLILLARSIAGAIGVFANFYALGKIPIGEAMTLNKMAPFFTVLFSWIFLKERMRSKSFVCLLVAFLGAAMVMKPGFRPSGSFAVLCALIGGIGAGIAYTAVRELGIMKVPSTFIVLFFSAFTTIASIPLMLGGYKTMTVAQILILTGAGFGAAIGQFGITLAYRFASPSKIAVFDYTSIVFSALFGYIFFSQRLDMFSAAGIVLIVVAALLSRKQ